jgi:hypothetical protein
MEAPVASAGNKINCLKCAQRLQIPPAERAKTILAPGLGVRDDSEAATQFAPVAPRPPVATQSPPILPARPAATRGPSRSVLVGTTGMLVAAACLFCVCGGMGVRYFVPNGNVPIMRPDIAAKQQPLDSVAKQQAPDDPAAKQQPPDLMAKAKQQPADTAGKQKPPDIVGKWEQVNDLQTIAMEFKRDGTGELSIAGFLKEVYDNAKQEKLKGTKGFEKVADKPPTRGFKWNVEGNKNPILIVDTTPSAGPFADPFSLMFIAPRDHFRYTLDDGGTLTLTPLTPERRPYVLRKAKSTPPDSSKG